MEERRAAQHEGYKWREWLALDRQDRLEGVAAYRLDRMIELHAQEATHRHVRRQAARRQAAQAGGAA